MLNGEQIFFLNDTRNDYKENKKRLLLGPTDLADPKAALCSASDG